MQPNSIADFAQIKTALCCRRGGSKQPAALLLAGQDTAQTHAALAAGGRTFHSGSHLVESLLKLMQTFFQILFLERNIIYIIYNPRGHLSCTDKNHSYKLQLLSLSYFPCFSRMSALMQLTVIKFLVRAQDFFSNQQHSNNFDHCVETLLQGFCTEIFKLSRL